MTYPWLKSAEQAFASYARAERIPHALLISGAPGSGKLDLARRITQGLLCLEHEFDACGDCRSCTLFVGGAHPDFREVTFETQEKSDKLSDVIKVSQIRKLIDALNKTTTISTNKAAIIQPAGRMNESAANALLKTLEEPVGNTYLVLVTPDPSALPATVRSRCQSLNVVLPSASVSCDWLVGEHGVDSRDARLAVAASAGSPLHALEFVRNGLTDSYRGMVELLSALRAGRLSAGQATAELGELDPDQLWLWLSLRCAGQLRGVAAGQAASSATRSLMALQSLADRNRKLVATTVRQDFLIRDWLIQWKSLPLDRLTQEA